MWCICIFFVRMYVLANGMVIIKKIKNKKFPSLIEVFSLNRISIILIFSSFQINVFRNVWNCFINYEKCMISHFCLNFLYMIRNVSNPPPPNFFWFRNFESFCSLIWYVIIAFRNIFKKNHKFTSIKNCNHSKLK